MGAYQSTKYPNLYAATTGPGVTKAAEIREILKTIMPDLVVNAGLVGMLLDEESPLPGDLIRLGSVVDAESRLIFPMGRSGHTLVTIRKPVFEPRDKWILSRDYQAQFCDMEAAKIIQLMRNLEDIRDETPILFCKVVGEIPAQHDLFQHEVLVRSWHRRGFFGRILTGLKFPGGPRNLSRLIKLKRRALDGLKEHTSRTLRTVLSGSDPESIGGIYAPP